jgi:hypothetical protein
LAAFQELLLGYKPARKSLLNLRTRPAFASPPPAQGLSDSAFSRVAQHGNRQRFFTAIWGEQRIKQPTLFGERRAASAEADERQAGGGIALPGEEFAFANHAAAPRARKLTQGAVERGPLARN